MRTPNDIVESLHRYVFRKIPTGGFLEAVLSNDLYGACCKADSRNRNLIFEIVAFVANTIPRRCYGSYERVHQWVNDREPGDYLHEDDIPHVEENFRHYAEMDWH